MGGTESTQQQQQQQQSMNEQGTPTVFYKSLTCRICSKRYVEPKNMPGCGHVFCLECLKKLAEKSVVSNRIECPLCSKYSTTRPNGVQDFHTNLAILEVIQELDPFGWSNEEQDQSKQVPDRYHCRNCRQKRSRKCDHCAKYFCETCLHEHHWALVQNMQGQCSSLSVQLASFAMKMDDQTTFRQAQLDLLEEEKQLAVMENDSQLEKQWEEEMVPLLRAHKAAMIFEARSIIQGRLTLIDKVQRNKVNLQPQLSHIVELVELAHRRSEFQEFAASRYLELEKLKAQLTVLEMIQNGKLPTKIKLVTNVQPLLNKQLQLWEITADLIDRQQFRELATMEVKLPEISSQNPKQKEEDFAIGIDYGTSYIRAAVFQNGKIEMIMDELDETVVPASLSFGLTLKDVPVCFGKKAQNAADIRPTNTFFAVKRLLAKQCGNNNCFILPTFTLDSDNPNNSVILQRLGEETHRRKTLIIRPEVLIAMQLGHIKDLARKQLLGKEVVNAVISIPAMFTDGQREAMLSAARMAGFKRARLFSESLLTAVSYSYDRNLVKKCLMLVVVFGGGSFEMSLVETQATNHSCEMVRATGQADLGGIDFDCHLMTICLEKIGPEATEAIKADKKAMFHLKRSCEKSKNQLRNEKSSVSVSVECGGEIYECGVTLQDLGEKVKPLLERVKEQIRFVCPKRRRGEVSDVIFAGGMCRLKLIQDQFFEYFDDCEEGPQFHYFTHDEAVVRGAALTAANVFGEPSDDPSSGIIDRNPYGIGFSKADCHTLLREANSRVNIAQTFSSSLLPPQQPVVQLMQSCGRFMVDFGLLKVSQQIDGEVSFTVITDENGTVDLKCSSGQSSKIQLEKKENRQRLYSFEEADGVKLIDKYRELNAVHEKKGLLRNEILAQLYSLKQTGRLTQEQLTDEEKWLGENESADLGQLETYLLKLSEKYARRLLSTTSDENYEEAPQRSSDNSNIKEVIEY